MVSKTRLENLLDESFPIYYYRKTLDNYMLKHHDFKEVKVNDWPSSTHLQDCSTRRLDKNIYIRAVSKGKTIFPHGIFIYDAYIFINGAVVTMKDESKFFNANKINHLLKHILMLDEGMSLEEVTESYIDYVSEVVVCAANRYTFINDKGIEESFIVAGVRHHVCYYDPRVIELRENGKLIKTEEGFQTNRIVTTKPFPTYRFVDRKEAKLLTKESKQIMVDYKSYNEDQPDLFSESLYPSGGYE